MSGSDMTTTAELETTPTPLTPEATATLTPEATAIRARLMQDRVPAETLGPVFGVTPRMIHLWAQEGMPFLRIDGYRYFRVSEVEEWLSRRRERRIAMKLKVATAVAKAPQRPKVKPKLAAPRPVGRPRKETQAA
jgi:hypothetical protein